MPESTPEVTMLKTGLRLGDAVTWKRVTDCVTDCGGNNRAAARALGVPERLWYRWLNAIPALRRLVTDARDLAGVPEQRRTRY